MDTTPLREGHMAIHIRRRKFIVTLGSAVAWPIAARAQQPGRIRKVAMLMIFPEADPTAQPRVAVFRRTLHELGWKEEENLQIVYRWNAGDAQHVNVLAAELAKLQPVCAPTARGKTGSAAAPAARCKNLRRGSFIGVLLPDRLYCARVNGAGARRERG